MNIHLFYLKPLEEYSEDVPSLYAYTNDKQLALEFIEQRNMDKFIYRKQWIDKKGYNQFDSKHIKLHLSYGTFPTVSRVDLKSIPVRVLCTWAEEESIIKNSERLWDEYGNILFDARIFEDEYLKALEKLLFIKFYGFYKIKYIKNADNFYEPYYTSYGPVESLIMEEFNESFYYDELALFLKFFKDLFKTTS